MTHAEQPSGAIETGPEPDDEHESVIFRLLYSSVAAADLNRREMSDLMDASRRLNARDGITGVLVYLHDHEDARACFVQVLEGPQTRVEATYRRIVTDERHHTVVLLAVRPTSHRSYRDWTMRLHQLSNPQAARFLPRQRQDPSRHPPLWITDLPRVEHFLTHLRSDPLNASGPAAADQD